MAPRKTGGKGTKSKSKASKSGRSKTSRRMSSSAPVMMPPALHSYSPSMDMDMDHGSGSEGWSLTLVFLGLLVLGGVVVAILWATGVFDKSETGGGNGTASPTSPPSSVPPGPAPAPGPGPSGDAINIGITRTGKGINVGGMIGIGLGSLFGLALLIALVMWIRRMTKGGSVAGEGDVDSRGWMTRARSGLGQVGSTASGLGSRMRGMGQAAWERRPRFRKTSEGEASARVGAAEGEV